MMEAASDVEKSEKAAIFEEGRNLYCMYDLILYLLWIVHSSSAIEESYS